MGQLAKQLAEKSTWNSMANTQKNPKEECKVVLTKSKRKESLEKEERVEGVVEDVSDEEVEDERKEKEADNKEKELRDEKNEKEKNRYKENGGSWLDTRSYRKLLLGQISILAKELTRLSKIKMNIYPKK